MVGSALCALICVLLLLDVHVPLVLAKISKGSSSRQTPPVFALVHLFDSATFAR
jgi:hypothetical protein